MTSLTLFAPKLTANRDDRTLSGLLLPFGEEGRTNLGRLTATAESALDAAEDVILNSEHAHTRPIGRLAALERSPEGLRASFRVVETRDGDDALTEAAEGLRAALSIEIEPIVTRAGRIISGTITGAALVARPAFPSARLAAAEDQQVPDLGDDPDAEPKTPAVLIDGEKLADVESVEVTPEAVTITTAPSAHTPEDPEEVPAALAASEHKEDTDMTAPVVQNAALVAAQKKTSKNALFATLTANAQSGQAKLEAALSDIVPGDILGVEQPTYIGELWGEKAYERRIIPLYNHAELNSFKVQGWRWVTKPEVDDYAGNKTAVPSNEVETEAVEIDAYRLAGAHDIDRKFRDFNSTEFWASYYAAMTESVAKKSDFKVRDKVRDSATRVHLLNAAMTSGVPLALNLIVKGVLRTLDTLERFPDHALVTADLWEPLLYTKEQDVLTYLNAALNLREGTLESGGFRIVPVKTGSLTVDLETDFVGKVLVGCKDAVTVHELGGGAPIRVEAPNVAQAGIDSGVFYYGAVNVHEAEALVLYDTPTAS